MVDNHEDPPPLYPSAARAKDFPPDSERGGFKFDARQHLIDSQLGNKRRKLLGVACLVSESMKRAEDVAQYDRAAHASDSESDASGYETDTAFMLLMTRLMTTMTMVTKPWLPSLLQKRFTSPRTS